MIFWLVDGRSHKYYTDPYLSKHNIGAKIMDLNVFNTWYDSK
jgi:hypothetical protein